MKTILVTNDDGIYGAGLEPLVKALKKAAKVTVVVPERERSGTSHSITLHKPFRVHEVKKGYFTANGTPADCVKYAVHSLLKNKVDLVVSGINSCPNIGQDIIYSGTVAGAREAAMLNIPAFAISVSRPEAGIFESAAVFAGFLAAKILANDFPDNVFLNVNVPKKPRAGVITSLGQRIYDKEIECRTDPRGKKYYWLSGKFISGVKKSGTDYTALENGYTSITPLRLDPTAKDLFGVFNTWIKDLS